MTAPQILRDYQSRALDELRESILSGKRRTLLVAPTGSGKTTIAAAMIAGAVAKQGAVLFLAHRKELIDQCSTRLDGAGVDHGVIQSGNPRNLPWLRVQVASIPTLSSRLQRGGALPAATIIIIDEAHHARARTYGAILDAYPGAVVIGLTATPWRTDGRGLGELFEHIVVAARPRELIEQGHLVPYAPFAYDSPEVKRVKKAGSDYDQHQLEAVMGERRIVGNVVQQYIEHASGKRALVFAVTVKHSRDLVERFIAAGVRAEHVDGETETFERKSILARFTAGATKVVCNVGVWTEGMDCPAIECVILARPTLSPVLYLQMVGRGLRPSPGKSVCLIHDHGGCIAQHGLPAADREYSLDLDDRPSGDTERLPPLRTCKACFAIYPAASGTACPACGHVNPASPRDVPKEIDNESVKRIPISELPFFKEASESKQRAHYEKLVAAAAEAGHRPGAAAMKFKAIYGHWPSSSWRKPGERAVAS